MISRRLVLVALAASPLAACQTANRFGQSSDADASWYVGSLDDEPFDIPLVDRRRMKPDLARQMVAYPGPEKPGTVVVDIDERYLYLVQPGNEAIRYGVGVGRQGFSWHGVASVGRKGVWPNWSPTKTMVGIKPELPRYRAAGLDNPLGARALYLYQNGGDTLFRITSAPTSPGRSASRSRPAASACSTRTSSTSTTAFRSARRCWCGETAAGGCRSRVVGRKTWGVGRGIVRS